MQQCLDIITESLKAAHVMDTLVPDLQCGIRNVSQRVVLVSWVMNLRVTQKPVCSPSCNCGFLGCSTPVCFVQSVYISYRVVDKINPQPRIYIYIYIFNLH